MQQQQSRATGVLFVKTFCGDAIGLVMARGFVVICIQYPCSNYSYHVSVFALGACQGPLIERLITERDGLNKAIATQGTAVADLESRIRATLERAGIEEAQYDADRARQAEELAAAIASVAQQALDDGGLNDALETLTTDAAKAIQELAMCEDRRSAAEATREELSVCLDKTRMLWNARQEELKAAQTEHQKEIAAAKIQFQQLREVEDVADERRRAAKARLRVAEAAMAEVRDEIGAVRRSVAPIEAERDTCRRAGDQCEVEMRRIAAQHIHIEQSLAAAVKLRSLLEQRLTDTVLDNADVEYRLAEVRRVAEERLADLRQRDVVATSGIDDTEAEILSIRAAAESTLAMLSAEIDSAASAKLQGDRALALARSRDASSTQYCVERQQQAQSARNSVASKTAAWDAERAALDPPLAALQEELARYDDAIAQHPRRRSLHVKGLNDTLQGQQRADERRETVEGDIQLLRSKCLAREADITTTRTVEAEEDKRRVRLDTRREEEAHAQREWSKEIRAATNMLTPATQSVSVANARIARSYDTWYDAFVGVKSAYARALGEYAAAQTAAGEARALVDAQRRAQNAFAGL